MTSPSADRSANVMSTDQIAGIESPKPSTDDSTMSNDEAAMPRTEELQPADTQLQLLADDEMQPMLTQWQKIQGGFVDEPRQAIHDADALVADLMQRLARTFAEQRDQLDAQLTDGNDVTTEDLRLGLRRYRSFFERLLAA